MATMRGCTSERAAMKFAKRHSGMNVSSIHATSCGFTARPSSMRTGVKEIHSWLNGYHAVLLENGQELRMSRYQSEAAKRLGLTS
jgi:hypothetical protein